jgi:hypothetical protein
MTFSSNDNRADPNRRLPLDTDQCQPTMANVTMQKMKSRK